MCSNVEIEGGELTLRYADGSTQTNGLLKEEAIAVNKAFRENYIPRQRIVAGTLKAPNIKIGKIESFVAENENDNGVVKIEKLPLTQGYI